MSFGTRTPRPVKKKRRLLVRRKRTLDPNLIIDYKKPDTLKRFITDRGKIIPRRISGATAVQQRRICLAIKRARFLSLIPYSQAHRQERGFAGEVSMAYQSGSSFGGGGYRDRRDDRMQRHDNPVVEADIDTDDDSDDDEE